jgi:nicotinamide-nucleotide amidase
MAEELLRFGRRFGFRDATPIKPVGLVHLAVAQRGGPTRHVREVFPGDRSAIRLASVDAAITLALQAVGE